GGRVGALLGREDPRGALRPVERTLDVARHLDGRVAEPWVHAREVDRREAADVRAPSGQLPAVPVEEPDAEGPREAQAAVGGGATADGDDDTPRAEVEGRPDQLAGAEGAGRLRVALAGGQALVAGRSPGGPSR